MFGKKDEYDGFGNYRQSDDYGYNQGTNTDDAKRIFQPFLEEGEVILWSMCSGNGNASAQFPAESDEPQSSAREMQYAKLISAIKTPIGVILLIFVSLTLSFIGVFLFCFASVIMNVLMFILVAAVLVLLIWYAEKGNKNVSYAITDRRLVKYAYSQFNELRLEDIKKTKVVIGNENKGKVIATGLILQVIIPDVEDPYSVKNILDNAIDNCEFNQSQC